MRHLRRDARACVRDGHVKAACKTHHCAYDVATGCEWCAPETASASVADADDVAYPAEATPTACYLAAVYGYDLDDPFLSMVD
jgi:hypothetical protein